MYFHELCHYYSCGQGNTVQQLNNIILCFDSNHSCHLDYIKFSPLMFTCHVELHIEFFMHATFYFIYVFNSFLISPYFLCVLLS